MSARASWLLVLALGLWPGLVGLLSPSDVGAHDQGKQVMYVVDALEGHWLLPHERAVPATKPPLYTWLAALAGGAFGLGEVTVRLPSLVACVALCLATFAIGLRSVGRDASLLGVALLAVTQHLAKLSFFARTDMLLAAFVAGAMLAWLAGRTTAFWLCVGLAVLAKGPVGLAVPLVAVAVVLLARRDRDGLRRLAPLRGLAIVIAVVAVWFVPAFVLHRAELVSMIQVELLEQMTGTGEYADVKHQPFWYLVSYLFLKLAPWSPLLLLALRDTARPAQAAFPLVAWLGGGLFLFLFPATKRPDHLLPLYAPAALLAGVVVARFVAGSAAPGLARGLDAGARLWAGGAAAAALAMLPLAAAGVVRTNTSPPLAAWLACGLALLPLAHALRGAATPRARVAAALAAQALAVFAHAQVGTAAAKSGESPPMRAFAREVAAAVGDEEIVLVETDSYPLQFLLRRNVRERKREALPALAAAPAPSWVALPEALAPALPNAERVAVSPPRPGHDGERLVLLRTRGG